MTLSHLASMEGSEGSKGDNRENYDGANESTRDVITLNVNHEGENKKEDLDAGVKKSGRKRSGKSREMQIPTVTIENPTPTPRPVSGRKEKEKGKDYDEEGDDDDDDEDMDYDTGEEEEVEEEEEDMDMTPEEKQAMYESVKEGDIDALEDCLDLPNADINMIWFQENLLMTAIRAGHTEMAEFLVDNGIDHSYSTSRMAVRETPEGVKKFDRYHVDCRQMAFEYELDDLVFLLDHLQGRLFPFVPAPKRSPRMRRPPPPSITPTDSNMEDEGNSSDADVSDTSSHQTMDDRNGDENRDSERRKRKKKNKRGKAENRTAISDKDNGQSQGPEDEELEEKDKTAWTASTFTEVDSGNYSMASGSKLKKNIVDKHNKMLELDLDSKDAGDNKSSKTNSPRKSTVSGEVSEKNREKNSQNENEEREDEEGRTDTSRSKSMSTSIISPSNLSPPLPEIPHPPNDPIRFNRSNLSVQKSVTLRKFYTTPLNESNMDTPLAWKKVYTTGSYVKESKNWHRDKNKPNTNNNTSGRSKSDLEISTTSSLSTGIETQLKPSLKSGQSSSLRGTAAASAPTQQRINSSLLTPSTTSSSFSSLSSQPTPSPTTSLSPRPRTIDSSHSMSSKSSASILKPPRTSSSVDKNSSNNNKHIRFSSDPAASNASKSSVRPTTVAGYMRPTQSTITKQRLYPRFVDSYGGLDFHHVAGKPQIFRLNLNADRSSDIKVSSSISSVTSSASKATKSNLQRRNYNSISYRS